MVKEGGVRALPTTVRLTAGVMEKGNKLRRRGLESEVGGAARIAGVSTASLGKFDRLLKGESRDDRDHKKVMTKVRPGEILSWNGVCSMWSPNITIPYPYHHHHYYYYSYSYCAMIMIIMIIIMIIVIIMNESWNVYFYHFNGFH